MSRGLKKKSLMKSGTFGNLENENQFLKVFFYTKTYNNQ